MNEIPHEVKVMMDNSDIPEDDHESLWNLILARFAFVGNPKKQRAILLASIEEYKENYVQ